MRKMTKFLIVLSLHFCFTTKMDAKTPDEVKNKKNGKSNSLVINGIFDNPVADRPDRVQIQAYENYFYAADYIDKDSHYAKVTNGLFRFSMDALKGPIYLAIKYKVLDKWKVFSFLAEPGDSIEMRIAANEVTYAGRGADKYACQDKLFAKDSFTYRRYKDDYDRFWHVKSLYDTLYIQKNKILDGFKSRISETAYKILQIDLEGKKNLDLLPTLTLRYRLRNDEQVRSNIRRAFKEYTPTIAKPDRKKNGFYHLSKYYSDFIFRKERFETEITVGPLSSEIFFPNLYKKINQGYHGLLREKLITTCFLELFERCREVNDYIDEALNTVTKEEYRSLIDHIRISKSPGSPAYDFSLENEQGKMVKLKDLRGKTVIVDFWFNGCVNCAILNKLMEPVIDSFDNNKDVVFLSVNVDSARDVWKKALSSGKYTHKESLNVFTNGQGYNHPMIFFYGYKGFPKLLVIDKEGKIISASPPRPITPEDTEKFIALIKSSIER